MPIKCFHCGYLCTRDLHGYWTVPVDPDNEDGKKRTVCNRCFDRYGYRKRMNGVR